MEKTSEKFTPDLFDCLAGDAVLHSANAPDLDIEVELLAAVKVALKQAKKLGQSRERIVERMNLCLPAAQHVTLRQLNAWCAESKEFSHFPAKYLPAFIWACMGVVAPLSVIAGALGLGLLDEDEQLATELGKTLQLEAELKQRKRLLQARIRR